MSERERPAVSSWVNARNIHSFIFSERFMLVRVAVDSKPTLGILGMRRWEYSRDES